MSQTHVKMEVVQKHWVYKAVLASTRVPCDMCSPIMHIHTQRSRLQKEVSQSAVCKHPLPQAPNRPQAAFSYDSKERPSACPRLAEAVLSKENVS